MKKTETVEISEGNMKKRQIERVVFSRRPVAGDYFRVTKTQTTFGPAIPIMADDCVSRSTFLEAIADDERARAITQLEIEIPLLSNPDLRRWLLYVAKKIGIGGTLTLTRDDGAKLLALVRFAVGLDDLLRALDKKDPKEIARLRALYGKKKEKKK